ncbi:MAG: winged helix DNA-binding protein [Bacteroidota bacterium]
MKYQKLKELIDLFDQFESESGSDDIVSFSRWIQQRENELRGEKMENYQAGQLLESDILRHFGRVSNFARHYIRKATRNSPLVGWNDLVAIIVLYFAGDMRKTELIQRCLIELSPGMEVVRRLLRLGLIEEFPDPDDGRAKRINLTDAGREMFVKMEAELKKVGTIVSGNLSENEKQQLQLILEKLGHFHDPIWQDDEGSSLESIIEKYLV